MKKTLLLLAILFTTTVLWAGNVITYTATDKLPETTTYGYDPNGLHTDAFGSEVSISSHTFTNGIGTITFNKDITEIGDDAFYGCSGLTSITIPNSVTSIGDYAFYGCSDLTSVTIPNRVTSIGHLVFGGCSGLTSIIVDKNNPIYDSRNGCNAIIRTATNELIKGCNATIIPNTVTSIGERAFKECSDLTSITIPNSVTTIEEEAFMNCIDLKSIFIPSSVTSIGDRPFSNCEDLTSIIVDGNNPIYDSRNGCNAIIKTATNQLIQGCNATIIPNSVTNIGDFAFIGLSGFTSIVIPDSVTSIGDFAFYDCDKLISITIGNGVTSIGLEAFYNCSSLKTVYDYARLPQNIGISTFFPTKVKTLYVPTLIAVDRYKKSSWDQYFANILPMTDEMLDVKNIQYDTPATQTYYDLNGRKMKEPQHGLNIINGNTVIVK